MPPGEDCEGSPLRISFDDDGPRFGATRLLAKTRLGFSPQTPEDLRAAFSAYRVSPLDIDRLAGTLVSIAREMNKGDIALAAMMVGQLRLVGTPLDSGFEASLSKASVDDPKHPGYPAGTADGKGGQFRPQDAAAVAATPEAAERLKRLATRKTFRSIARRVLSMKRVMKFIARYLEGEAVQEIPVLNDVVGLQSLADDIDLMTTIGKDVADSDAAIEFVNKGPFELNELQQSPGSPESFTSFNAFKKIELEKQFGPAGDGYEYHHIVEQGPNAANFTQAQLQSTDNIIRIPRLFHEEINSIYSKAENINGTMISPRDFLRGKSFEEQRQFGINELRKIGVIH